MASKAPSNDSTAFRGSLRNLWRAILIVVPIVGLVLAIYMIAGGGNPRHKLKTVPATLEDYTRFITAYVGPMRIRPDNLAISFFLEYFDDNSRDFFEKHYEDLARQAFQFDEEGFKQTSKETRRGDAMLNLASRSPLDGFGAIHKQQTTNPSTVEINVDTRQHSAVTITLHKSGTQYYIENFGGLIPVLEKEFSTQSTPTK